MSKSFDVNVSFNFRAVFGEEALAQLQQNLDETRLNPAVHPAGKAILAAYDKDGIEGVLQFCLRDSVKQMKSLIIAETPSEVFKNFSPFTAVITSRASAAKPQVACVVPSQECTCNFCRSF